MQEMVVLVSRRLTRGAKSDANDTLVLELMLHDHNLRDPACRRSI
jgi:hypothetical protein